MGSLPRPCITPRCAGTAHGAPRCNTCERVYQFKRNADPKRAKYKDPAYKAIKVGGICWLCGLPGADTRDHVVPVSLGGTNDPTNIKPAHAKCNSARGNRVASEVL